MNLLSRLDDIRKDIKNLSISEMFRKTRDVLGIKQFKMAELIDCTKEYVKRLEYKKIRIKPDRDIIRRFCDTFEYDFNKVWGQIEVEREDYLDHIEMKSKDETYFRRISR